MYFRQPAYYGDFRCVGGDCIFTCCQAWRIGFKKESLEKTLSAPNISDELLSLINDSYKVSDNDNFDYLIKFREDRHCPLLNENGLCRVHRELGAEYLLPICRTYPRINRMALDCKTQSYSFIYRFCHLSCSEVSKRLVTDKKAMNLVNISPNREKTVEDVEIQDEKAYQQHPELLSRTDLFEFFYDLISDKKYPLEAAIFYGAIAATILTDVVKEKQYASIPQVLSEMKAGFSKGDMLREFEKISTDYNVKVGFAAGIIRKYISKSTLNTLDNGNGKLSMAAYEHGEKNLAQALENNDFWLRNFALNLLFEYSIPFYSAEHSIWESYSLFVAALACIKLNAVSAMIPDSDAYELRVTDDYIVKFSGLDKIYGYTSLVCRDICQNRENGEGIIEMLKAANLTTPGQLALLIK